MKTRTDGNASASPQFGVVLCTFNRARLLSICLETLVAQDFPQDAYEIIVVDNNSTDETAERVARMMLQCPQLRYVTERKQGLSHARNRGWRETSATYVAYVDDECRIPPNWLASAASLINERRPGMLGGPYVPWYETDKPRWFHDRYGGTLHLRPEAETLAPSQYLSGGNMFIRRDLIASLGGFDTTYGMVGATLAYGEETEFQLRLRQHRPEQIIYYDPKLTIEHVVRPEKMKLPHAFASHIARGRTSGEIFVPSWKPANDLAYFIFLMLMAIRGFFMTVWHSSVGLLFRDRELRPYPENHLYEVAFRHAQEVAAALQRLTLLIRRRIRFSARR